MTHIVFGNQGRLCGARIIAWPDKYMDDKFARTLPRCPKCVKILQKIREKKSMEDKNVQGTFVSRVYEPDKKNPPSAPDDSPLYLIDFADYKKRQ